MSVFECELRFTNATHSLQRNYPYNKVGCRFDWI
jgi:hypothetical protein